MTCIIYLSDLGIEQRCKEIGYVSRGVFFDNIKDIKATEIEGIIAVGKFSDAQVKELQLLIQWLCLSIAVLMKINMMRLSLILKKQRRK